MLLNRVVLGGSTWATLHKVSPGRIPTFVDGEVEVGPRDECLQRFRALSEDMLERRLADREELIRGTGEMFEQVKATLFAEEIYEGPIGSA